MRVKYTAKMFFDSEKVLKALSRKEIRVLSAIGAHARKDARRSLRPRKKASSPGSPPSIHTKNKFFSLKNIQFEADLKSKSVIVGPILLRTSNVKSTKTLPELMEFGGRAMVEVDRDKMVPANYPARPTMGPTLDRTLTSSVIPDAMQKNGLQ